MYSHHFGLSGAPFSIAPDPRYLYLSQGHREALAHLLYGTQSGGFVMLSGEVGTGKTTICRCFLEQLPEKCDVALILNPRLTTVELLATLRDELGIAGDADETSPRQLVDVINRYLLAAHARGRTTLLLIDEAQNLRPEVLEQLRLLTNLETNEKKLLQILLVGQPELQTLLARPSMRQVAQRITARYHLCTLSSAEVGHYVRHRLSVAQCQRRLFNDVALRRLAQLSAGVPRLINLICDRALLAAYAEQSEYVDDALLRRAAIEVLPPGTVSALQWPRWVAAATLAGCAIALAWFSDQRADGSRAVEQASRAPPREVLPTASAAMVKASRQAAYRGLFRLWQLDYQPQRDGMPCDYARRQGLRCLSANGGFEELRHADRPAVLSQFSWQGQRGLYALWSALDAQHATLQLNDQTLQFDAAQLQPLMNDSWGGQYTVLWRPPAAYSGALQYGATGSLVTWLAHQRALLEGGASIMPERLDGELLAWARRLQGEIGREDETAVGPEVLIYLNNILGATVPKLQGKQVEEAP